MRKMMNTQHMMAAPELPFTPPFGWPDGCGSSSICSSVRPRFERLNDLDLTNSQVVLSSWIVAFSFWLWSNFYYWFICYYCCYCYDRSWFYCWYWYWFWPCCREGWSRLFVKSWFLRSGFGFGFISIQIHLPDLLEYEVIIIVILK